MTEVISNQPTDPKRKGRQPKPADLVRPKPAIIPEARLLSVATEYLCGHYHRNPEKLKAAAYADPDFIANLREVHARELLPDVRLALYGAQYLASCNVEWERNAADVSHPGVPFNKAYRVALYADFLYMEMRREHEWAFLSKNEAADRLLALKQASEEIERVTPSKGGTMLRHEWYVEAEMRLNEGNRYPQLVPEEMDALSMDDGEDEL